VPGTVYVLHFEPAYQHAATVVVALPPLFAFD
jgi:hypothetical protein